MINLHQQQKCSHSSNNNNSFDNIDAARAAMKVAKATQDAAISTTSTGQNYLQTCDEMRSRRSTSMRADKVLQLINALQIENPGIQSAPKAKRHPRSRQPECDGTLYTG